MINTKQHLLARQNGIVLKHETKWQEGEFRKWVELDKDRFISDFELSTRTLARWFNDAELIPRIYWRYYDKLYKGELR